MSEPGEVVLELLNAAMNILDIILKPSQVEWHRSKMYAQQNKTGMYIF